MCPFMWVRLCAGGLGAYFPCSVLFHSLAFPGSVPFSSGVSVGCPVVMFVPWLSVVCFTSDTDYYSVGFKGGGGA